MAPAGGGSGGGPAPDEQDAPLLEDAYGFAAEQRFYMRKAIAQRDLETALRCAICLTNELRTSQLSLEKYYKLYAVVFWELQHFAAFIDEGAQLDLDLDDVYALVQHEGNALPRVYLLVTVGAVLIRAHRARATEILDDLTAMLCAVQHPVRGLFLRYYFLQSVKDKLPHLGVSEALRYMLPNLRESISLWSRLRLLEGAAVAPHASSSRASAAPPSGEVWQLDPRRQVLRLLVGAQLMHLARQRELTVDLYAEALLPEVLRLITGCEDAAGQAYLLQCFVEVFPDDFHMQTLDRVLGACAQVHWAVDLRLLLQHLIRRLTAYVRKAAAEDASALPAPPPAALDPFAAFHAHLRQLHGRPRTAAAPLASLLALQLELLTAALALHPGDADRTALVLLGTQDLLSQRDPQEPLGDAAVEAIVDILAAPLTQEALVPSILALPHHAALLAGLTEPPARRAAAVSMVAAVLAGDVALRDCDTLHRLMQLIGPLLRDGPLEGDAAQALSVHDPVAFTREQEKMARLVHQVRHPDPHEGFRMLSALRTYFDEGSPHRLVFTLPATAAAALRLAQPLLLAAAEGGAGPDAAASTLAELFTFVRETIAGLGALRPIEVLRLWLLAAATANATARQAAALDGGAPGAAAASAASCAGFLQEALLVLEQDAKGWEAQLLGLQLLVGAVRESSCLDAGCYADAAERAVSVASGLSSRRLQCRGLGLCAALFWAPACRDGPRALRCLQGALRCADGAVHIDPLDSGLFIEVLDRASQLFEGGSAEVTAPFISCLLALCVQHLRYIGPRAPVETVKALEASVQALQGKRAEALGADAASRFKGLHLQAALEGMPPLVATAGA